MPPKYEHKPFWTVPGARPFRMFKFGAEWSTTTSCWAASPSRKAGKESRKWPYRFRSSIETREMRRDRKSTRLNSSHSQISYAVFCLKKKKQTKKHIYC